MMIKVIIMMMMIKKKITHGLKFIDSFRFMPCKSSDLVDNLSGT